MARTLILRPSSDISVAHSKSNTSSAGYALINEASPDDDSGYIYQSQTSSASTLTEKASSFGCTNSDLPAKFYLQGVSSTVRQRLYLGNLKSLNIWSYSTPSITLNSVTTNGSQITILRKDSVTSDDSTSYANDTQSYSSTQLNKTFTSDNFTLNLGITTSERWTSDRSISSYPQIRVTQAYATITYLEVYDCNAINVEGCSSVSVSADEVKEGESVTYTATIPSGYKFLGWFSDFACETLVSSSLSYTTTPTANLTLYAKAALIYNVSVYADSYCTVSVSPSSGVVGTQVTATCTPNDSMKEFVGWYSNSSRTTLVSNSNPYIFTLNSDTTLYAKCKLKYIMYLKINGQWHQCSKVFKKIDGAWVQQENLSGLFDTSKNYKKIDVD